MVPDLVPNEDLLGAVSLSSAQFNLGRVIGPALAGLALLSHDYAVVFGVNAASFAAVVVALVLLRLPPPSPVTGSVGFLRRIVDGARVAMAEPGCRSAIGLISLVALLASPFIALVPAMAGAIEHRGLSTQETTAVLVTAQGIGARSAARSRSRRWPERVGRLPYAAHRTFRPAGVADLYTLAGTLLWSALAFVAVGAVYIAVLSGLNTVVQLRAPAAARGRVLSIYMMGLGIVYPIGAVVQGAIANHVGVKTITIAGAVLLFAALAVLAALRPRAIGALGDPETLPPLREITPDEIIPSESRP